MVQVVLTVTITFKEEFNDKELRRLLRNLPRLNSIEIRYGWWDIAKYPKRHRARGRPVAQIAYWNEFGTFSKNGKRHIPPRPYLTQTGHLLKSMLRADIIKFFRDAIYNPKFSTLALSAAPEKIHAAFEAIVGTGTALSLRTIKLKGNDEHWRETGRLLKNFQAKIMKAKKKDD